MSDALFPSLPGLQWDRTRTPKFNTLLQTATSGKDTAVSLWDYPRYTYSVSYDILRSALAYGEQQTLMGFFNQRNGQFDSFLLDDPEDDSVTGQQIGTGDAQTLPWQLVRTYGGWTDIISDINGTPNVYVDGVLQASGWSLGDTGIITFVMAPATGAAITADFSYYWRCRFLSDELELLNAAYKWWECKKLEWITLR